LIRPGHRSQGHRTPKQSHSPILIELSSAQRKTSLVTTAGKSAMTRSALLPLGSPVFVVLAFVVGLVMLRLNLWRGWLVLRPASMRLLIEDPGELNQVPAVLEASHDALKAHGFVSVGSHTEHPRFGAATLMYDYANPTEGVFATLFEGPKWGVRFQRGFGYVPRAEAEGPAARFV